MQDRLFEYLEDDKTFDINKSTVAMSPKGVYAGFDNAVIKARYDPQGSGAVIGFYLELSHSSTVIRMNNADATQLQQFGVIVSSQGVKIIENSPVEVDVTTFPSTGYRYDLVVCEHEYTQVQGGSQAIYSIIEGLENENTVPNAPTILNKIIVGILKVYAQGTSEWKRSETPQFANADIRNIPSRLGTMWSHSYPTEVFKPIAGFLDLPKTGNIFNVSGAVVSTGSFQKSIALLPEFGDSFGTQSVQGTVIYLFANTEAITILDKNTLDNLPYTSTNYQKPIRTGTGGDVVVRVGGIVKLIERAYDWVIISVSDYEKNNFQLSRELKEKMWGVDTPFQSAVRTAISTINIKSSVGLSVLEVDSDGLIEIPQFSVSDLEAQRNIYNVNVSTGQYIVGLKNEFEVGSEVTLFFKGGDSVLKINKSQVSDKSLFISADIFDFEAKERGFVKGVQLENGFFITEGSCYENWITPNLPQVVQVSANGAFKYKVCKDGTIKFDGLLSLPPSTTDVLLLSLPKSLFKFGDWLLSRKVAVPSIDDYNGKLTTMVYFIEGDFVKFVISSDTNSESFNFNGLYISYR